MSSTTSTTPSAREGLLAAARAELAERGHAAISLRAVARRAGVSHAAPKYHFDDRAALLTAIAAQGFGALTAALRKVTTVGGEARVAALGAAYIDFGLANPALFDLMFRPTELHPDDPELRRAQQEAIAVLSAATADSEPSEGGAPASALVSWALAHGLVVLIRDGALQSAAGTRDSAALAHELTSLFATRMNRAAE